MLLKVDCLPNAVGKQPSIPFILEDNGRSTDDDDDDTKSTSIKIQENFNFYFCFLLVGRDFTID